MSKDGSRDNFLKERASPMDIFQEAILMTSDTLTAAELIAVITVYFIVFCPILCWAIGVPLPSKQSFDSFEEQSHA